MLIFCSFFPEFHDCVRNMTSENGSPLVLRSDTITPADIGATRSSSGVPIQETSKSIRTLNPEAEELTADPASSAQTEIFTHMVAVFLLES